MIEALRKHPSELATYPATAGSPEFRQACSAWLKRRYAVDVNPDTEVLPVNGSREALFAFAQTVLDGNPQSIVVSPNPFYQIYEGAAILGNARIHYAPSLPNKNFAVDWDSVSDDIWHHTRLLFVCSPGNPTGAVMPLEEWQKLFALSDKYVLSSPLTSVTAKYILGARLLWAAYKQPPYWVVQISNNWSASPACPSAAMHPVCAAALWRAMLH
jgi:aspartate/methionine/tyrosine aminotransferase